MHYDVLINKDGSMNRELAGVIAGMAELLNRHSFAIVVSSDQEREAVARLAEMNIWYIVADKVADFNEKAIAIGPFAGRTEALNRFFKQFSWIRFINPWEALKAVYLSLHETAVVGWVRHEHF